MKQNWIAELEGGHFEGSCVLLKQVGLIDFGLKLKKIFWMGAAAYQL